MTALTIAIDGPASAGKGTVARGVARALGYGYVDTGAMYRSVAWMARENAVSWRDEAALAAVATGLGFSFGWDGDVLRIQVNGVDLTRLIRTDTLGRGASTVSAHPQVRDALLDLQRDLGNQGGVVMDGRDIGTVVLPNADLKVYLDADVVVRARRRHEELLRRGEVSSVAQVQASLEARDRQDRERAVAPLAVAADAVVLDTTDLTIGRAVDAVLALALARGAVLVSPR